MSGPKVDEVTIARLRAQQLAAERERNALIAREALSRVRSLASASRRGCLELTRHADGFRSRIDALERTAAASVVTRASGGYPDDPDEARAFNDAAEQALRDLVADLEQGLSLIDEEVACELGEQRNVASIEQLATSMEGEGHGTYSFLSSDEVEELLSRDAAPAASTSEQACHDAEDSEIAEQRSAEARALLADIQLLVLSEGADAKRKVLLSRLVSDVRSAVDEDAAPADLSRAVVAAASIVAEVKTHVAIMEELYAECLIEQERLVQLTGAAPALPPLRDFAEEQELEARLADLKAASARAAEDAYIAHALEAVMAEHGYSVSRSVCLSKGDSGALRRIFMDENSDAGIHAYVAPNGTVVMETAAVGEGIRNADDGVQVERVRATSAYDKMRLLERQVSFCDLHPELLADLAEYGITAGSKSDLPPSEDNSIMFCAVGSAGTEAVEQKKAKRARREETALHEREMK